MVRPLKVRSNVGSIGVQEMSNTDINNLMTILIATDFANTDGVGSLNVNGSGTSIGSFIDTTRPDPIGTHPVTDAVTSTTYTFNQNLGSATGSLAFRPLKYNPRSKGLQYFSDAEIDTEIVTLIRDYIVNGGIGSYVLQSTAPASGTWAQVKVEI
jgi:hypothetical protein